MEPEYFAGILTASAVIGLFIGSFKEGVREGREIRSLSEFDERYSDLSWNPFARLGLYYGSHEKRKDMI